MYELTFEGVALNRLSSFEEVTLPHLPAAYNLARWLTRNDHDAQDVVQEAYMRALKFFGGFRGGDGRAWILKIVRNTCYTWLERNRPAELNVDVLDAELEAIESGEPDPEMVLLSKGSKELIHEALEELPLRYREVLIMRELEGLSYSEIAAMFDIPIGTVMSRLARARTNLRQQITHRLYKETQDDLPTNSGSAARVHRRRIGSS